MSDRKTVLQEQSIEEILASIRKIISEDSVSGPDNRIEEETKRKHKNQKRKSKNRKVKKKLQEKPVTKPEILGGFDYKRIGDRMMGEI